MKLSPNKTFPHPVLRADADDYLHRKFQATRGFEASDGYTPVLSFNFDISEESILSLLNENSAAYVLEIYCPTTSLHRVFRTRKKSGIVSFEKGDLYRRVEVNAFVVCTKDIPGHFSPNFNPEFGNSPFDLLAGDVLAIDEPFSCYWDVECIAPLHSVLKLVANDKIKKGTFAVDTEGDKVKIYMHASDKQRFEYMRISRQQKPYAMFVYFSAVAEVLRQMKESANDGGQDKRWYRAIEHQMNEIGKDVASPSIDLFATAQELMRKPFAGILPDQND